MKRRYVFLTAVIAAVMLAACAGNAPDNSAGKEEEGPDAPQTENKIEERRPDNIEIILKAADHPELDLGYTGSEGERAVCDFAIDTDGSLYILQRDGIVHKYSGGGRLLETYDLKLNDQGLTAYRLTCGGGKIYLLDGHNNAVITAEKDKIENVSVLDFSDVGMSKNFYADESGRLFMSFADLDEAYSAEVDVSGETAVITGRKQRGYLIGRNITYLPEVISDGSVSSVQVMVFREGQEADRLTIMPADSREIPVGLNIYGLSDGEYFGIMHSFVNEADDPDKEEYIQTPVVIAPDDATIRAAAFSLESCGTVELTPGGAYCMTIADDGLSVRPVRRCFTDIGDGREYAMEK